MTNWEWYRDTILVLQTDKEKRQIPGAYVAFGLAFASSKMSIPIPIDFRPVFRHSYSLRVFDFKQKLEKRQENTENKRQFDASVQDKYGRQTPCFFRLTEQNPSALSWASLECYLCSHHCGVVKTRQAQSQSHFTPVVANFWQNVFYVFLALHNAIVFCFLCEHVCLVSRPEAHAIFAVKYRFNAGTAVLKLTGIGPLCWSMKMNCMSSLTLWPSLSQVKSQVDSSRGGQLHNEVQSAEGANKLKETRQRKMICLLCSSLVYGGVPLCYVIQKVHRVGKQLPEQRALHVSLECTFVNWYFHEECVQTLRQLTEVKRRNLKVKGSTVFIRKQCKIQLFLFSSISQWEKPTLPCTADISALSTSGSSNNKSRVFRKIAQLESLASETASNLSAMSLWKKVRKALFSQFTFLVFDKAHGNNLHEMYDGTWTSCQATVAWATASEDDFRTSILFDPRSTPNFRVLHRPLNFERPPDFGYKLRWVACEFFRL